MKIKIFLSTLLFISLINCVSQDTETKPAEIDNSELQNMEIKPEVNETPSNDTISDNQDELITNNEISTICIMDVVPKYGVTTEEAAAITELLSYSIYTYTKNIYNIVDNSKRDLALQEQEFALSDISENIDYAVRIGVLLSADKLLTGSITNIGGNYILNIQIVNVNSGEIENTY